MLVRELIERLSALDPQMRVIMPSEAGDFGEVEGAYVDTVCFGPEGVMLVDERDPGGLTRVVRLVEAKEA
ncbi:MAG: hypothetical protein AB1942_12205 [Pseudomonadota bacterium]